MGGVLSRFLANRTARIACATALVGLSIWAMRFGMHGSCLFGVGVLGLVGSSLLAAPVFAGAFIWLLAELGSSSLQRVGLMGRANHIVALVFGLSVYVAIGVAGWLAAPSEYPGILVDRADSQTPMWVFWSMGYLIWSGNFSHYPCGY